MAETQQSLAPELKAYEALKKDLEEHHQGKWVVIHDGELIGTYDNLENAAKEAVRRFGKGPYLIRQVGSQPITLPASVAYRPIVSHADH